MSTRAATAPPGVSGSAAEQPEVTVRGHPASEREIARGLLHLVGHGPCPQAVRRRAASQRRARAARDRPRVSPAATSPGAAHTHPSGVQATTSASRLAVACGVVARPRRRWSRSAPDDEEQQRGDAERVTTAPRLQRTGGPRRDPAGSSSPPSAHRSRRTAGRRRMTRASPSRRRRRRVMMMPVAIAGRPMRADSTSPMARSRVGIANVENRAGSSVGSDPKVKSGTTVHSTMRGGPDERDDDAGVVGRGAQRPERDCDTDDREREVDDAGDDADRLGATAPEEVSQEQELQSEEVRNHDSPSTSVLPPTRSTKRSSRDGRCAPRRCRRRRAPGRRR